MTTLRLDIDASGMRQGATDAERALQGIDKDAKAATAAVAGLSGALSGQGSGGGGAVSAAQAAQLANKNFEQMSRVIGVGTGLTGIVGNLGRGMDGLSAAMTTAATVGLNFARVGGTASGLWSGLGAIMRAHPILTIATVISAAASALNLFASASSQAAEAQQRLAAAIKSAGETDALRGLRTRLGLKQDDKSYYQGVQRNLEQFILNSGSDSVSQSDLEALLGYKPQYKAGDFYVEKGSLSHGERLAGRVTENIRAEAARQLAEDRLRNIDVGFRIADQSGPSGGVSGAAARGGFDFTFGGAKLGGVGSDTSRFFRKFDQQGNFFGEGIGSLRSPIGKELDNMEQIQQQLQLMRGVGEDLGQVLANAFNRAADGALTLKSVLTDLRQVASGIVSQVLRNYVANAFTPTKSQQDASILPRPGG